MTTPSEPSVEPAPAIAPDRRLHPLSWLFVLLASLRHFAVPLIAVVIFGRRGEAPWELLGAAGAVVLAINALARYFTYRFRIERDGLRIRSGLLQRTFRAIPFRRIHNVTVHQGLLHRLAGVAEVRLESAGGVRPEAEMRVLRLADAQALEALVRQRRDAPDRPADADPIEVRRPRAEVLLELRTAELLRLGLISNRGMVVAAAGVGVLAQAGGGVVADTMQWLVRHGMALGGMDGDAAPGAAWLLAAGVLLFVALVVVLRLLSVALALLQFHGFELSEEDGRVQVDAGLVTRVRGNTPLRRIQAFSLRESLLHRFFDRRSLRVDTAIIENHDRPRSLRDLVPIAPPATIDALLARLFPQLGWPDLPWRPLHPRAWRRMLVRPSALLFIATAGLCWQFGAPGLIALAAWPLLALRARLLAGAERYAVDARTVAVRSGWLDRRWRFAEIVRLQGIELRQSPFDRRHRMATLWFDTAGANTLEPPLRARYLPEADARRLADEIGARLARSRLNW